MTYGFGETRGEGLVGLGIPGLYVEFVLVPLSPGAPSELRFHNTVLGFQVDPWSAEWAQGLVQEAPSVQPDLECSPCASSSTEL